MGASTRINCLFCAGESGEAKLSKEHLWSVPVCRGFGIDRTTPTGDPANLDAPPVRMDQVQVRIACESCNNGWMSDLENEMEDVVGWAWYRRRIESLTEGGALVLKAWSLKSLLVWSAYAGRIRSFGRSEEADFAFVPEATGARQLFRGQWREAVARATFGWGRVPPGPYLWGFGNPEVLPRGPDVPNARSAGVLALNLGELQLWVVDPLFSTAAVQLPPGVAPVAPGISFRRLSDAAQKPDLAAVVVDNRGNAGTP